MPKRPTETVVGLLFIIVSIVYLLSASLPTARHARTLLQIALTQPYAYGQMVLGIILGAYSGVIIGGLPTTWGITDRRKQRRLAIALGLGFTVCLLLFNSGHATIEPLLRSNETSILLYILPFSITCVASTWITAGITCLRRSTA